MIQINQPVFYEDSVVILYSTPSPTLFSQLIEQKLGTELKWQNWKSRILEFRQDGTLIIRREKKHTKSAILAKFDLNHITVTHLGYQNDLVSSNPLIKREIGIVISCKSHDGHDTQIRMIMTEDEQTKFYGALKEVVRHHNLESIKHASITAHMNDWKIRKKHINQSAMRTAIASAMDTFDSKSRKDHIIYRRGALKYLPVFFANDLVHGSWWFVIGSLMFVLSSALTLGNSFTKDLGDDDSILSNYQYRASWLLMTISGVFCTVGSLAFMRAVHEDPPMKPLFKWYHFQSDELLGSWLFLLATLPIIPYSLIYISASDGDLVYLGALAVSILLVIGSYLFVRACYPSEAGKKRMKIIQPVANFLCCCFCSKEWREFHLSNDWLAGTWFIYWGTLLAFFVCLVLLFVSVGEGDKLLMFIYGTGFVENFCFLLGSAYFVAGSYPEESEADEEDETADPDVEDSDGSWMCFRSTKKGFSSKSSKDGFTAPFLEKGSIYDKNDL